MKKTMALIAVLAAGITLASAAPVLSLHGAAGNGFFGTSFANDTVNQNPKTWGENWDFAFGAGLNFSLGGNFGIQPEVNLAINNAGYTYNTESTLSFNYMSVDVPVLLTFRVNKWNLLIGPYVSFPVTQLTKTVKASPDATAVTNTENIVNQPFTIWGLTVGAGYEERIGIGRLVIGARYSFDFTPIQIKNGLGVIDFTRRALYLDVSYKLALDF
ncbi:MAG: PorT family protein [Treponema sp.]|nr:PorT family protein [Treponema sp.]